MSNEVKEKIEVSNGDDGGVWVRMQVDREKHEKIKAHIKHRPRTVLMQDVYAEVIEAGIVSLGM